MSIFARPSPRKIDTTTIAQLSAHMYRAYEETYKKVDKLKKTGKMPFAPPLRRGGQKREFLDAHIEADFYIFTMKEEQLVKLAETFKVPGDINFHKPTPSCRPSEPPLGYVAIFLDSFDVV